MGFCSLSCSSSSIKISPKLCSIVIFKSSDTHFQKQTLYPVQLFYSSCRTVVLVLHLIFSLKFDYRYKPGMQKSCNLGQKIFFTLWGCIFPLFIIGQSNIFHSLILGIF
jgi:hypothetical protein